MEPAPAADLQLQPYGKRIHDRYANAVETARDLVGILVELSAGMELGHDDFSGRYTLRRMDVGRDAAPIVGDGAGTVRVEGNGNQRGMTGQRLIDRIVHHFVDHMVQARAIVRVADIHARPLADGIEALQDLDGLCAVFGRSAVLDVGLVAHEVLSYLPKKRLAKHRSNHAPVETSDIGVRA